MNPSPLGIALQGLLLGPLPIALHGLVGVAAPADDAPRRGGGRGRPRRPLPVDPRRVREGRDVEALLVAGAL